MKRKVILVSLDALAAHELEILRGMDGFKRIISEGAHCPELLSVYPSITYPAHTSIATGCLPARHGVVNNYIFDPFAEKKAMYSYAHEVKAKAIWDYANEAGKKCVSVAWPVSAGADMSLILPDMVPPGPRIWTDETETALREMMGRYAYPESLAKLFFDHESFPRVWMTGAQPDFDILLMELFNDVIRDYDFDIALLHVFGLDTCKHDFGSQSPECIPYLNRYGEFVNRLADYADKSRDEILLVVTGDHGAADMGQCLYLNNVMEQMGLCRYDGGKLVEWDALMDSADGMAYLRIREGRDPDEITKRVAERFDSHPGVKSFSGIVAEAAEGWGFSDTWGPNADYDGVGPATDIGNHGYLPDSNGMQSLLFAYGPSVARGRVVESVSIMDILPTICHYMGLPCDDVDGRIIPIF